MAAGRWQGLAPFRILSVDIECAGRKARPPSGAMAEQAVQAARGRRRAGLLTSRAAQPSLQSDA